MEKVRDEILTTLLKDYKPLYRFLKEAYYELGMKAKGVFKAPLNWFYQGTGEFGHFTDAERVFCFNQLGYVLLAAAFEKGDMKGLPTLSLEQFYSLQANGVFIVGSTNIKYVKPIISTEDFEGKIEVIDVFTKKEKGIAFVDAVYDFEGGKATGEVRTAILLRNLEAVLKK